MRKLEKYLPVILLLLTFLLLWYQLQSTQQYALFMREQQQLFVNDGAVMAQRYLSVGGLALLTGQWLAQYFSISWAGPLVTAVLATLAVWLLWHLMHRNGVSVAYLPLCVIPVAMLLHGMYDVYYRYDGWTAFCLTLALLWLYSSLQQRLSPWLRVLWGTGLTIAAGLLLGSVATLFAGAIVVLDFIGHARRPYLQFISVAALLLLATVLVLSGHYEGYAQALLNRSYYEPLIVPSPLYDLTWVAVWVLLASAALLRLLKTKTWYAETGILLFTAVVTLWANHALLKWENPKKAVLYRLQHDTIINNWDDILSCEEACNGHNYLYMNYVNMALAHKGRLLQDLFRYRQESPMALIVGGAGSDVIPETVMLHADLYYFQGNIGAAQEKAFDVNTTSNYGNPHMLQQLVKTNLIFGNYKVAEKYIRLLQKSRYKEWADSQLRFLNNDKAVAADKELGTKRRDLPNDDSFAIIEGPFADLMHTMETNPRETVARDYATAFVLTTRDNNVLQQFFDRFPTDKYFDELPPLVQQALLLLHEGDLDLCRKMGVSNEVIEQYRQFKDVFLRARSLGQNPIGQLQPKFGDTFWFYFMFN